VEGVEERPLEFAREAGRRGDGGGRGMDGRR
jgi:hypothetical protein